MEIPINGKLLVNKFSESCKTNKSSTIVVIQRESPQSQIDVSIEVSKALVEKFKEIGIQGLRVKLVEVPLNKEMGDGQIAVMVIGSSVLVYPFFAPVLTDEPDEQ